MEDSQDDILEESQVEFWFCGKTNYRGTAAVIHGEIPREFPGKIIREISGRIFRRNPGEIRGRFLKEYKSQQKSEKKRK